MSLTNISIAEKTAVSNLSSSKSTESLYSTNSIKSAINQRRIQKLPGRMSGNNEVRQRVASARMLRMKTLQNQLNDALQHISNLTNENRMLRTIHKRQDMALSKYENSNAELPQLLKSHAEEVRIWQAKYRGLHAQNRELAHKIKQKDTQMIQLTDQNKHLTQLNMDRKLEEREMLSAKVNSLEMKLAEKDEEIKLLVRKNALIEKNMKYRLAKEHNKLKEIEMKQDSSVLETLRGSSNIVEKTILNHQLRRTDRSQLPRAINKNNIHAGKLFANDKDCENKISLSLQHNAIANSNLFNKNQLFAEKVIKKRDISSDIQERTPISNSEGPSDSESNDKSNEHDTTYTKSDDDYEDNFEKESEQLSNGNHIIKATNDDYNDDNDLVIGEATNQAYDNYDSASYEYMLRNTYLSTKNDYSLSKFRRDFRDDVRKNESALDSLCDTLCNDIELMGKTQGGSAGDVSRPPPKLNIQVQPIKKARQRMDETKKTQLLAALKAIESKSSVDS